MVDKQHHTVALATFLGLASMAAGVVWAGSSLGKDIRCAAYLRSGGADNIRIVTARRDMGSPLSDAAERELLAGAEKIGCSFVRSL